MLLRRLVRVALLAFIAGPALNLDCFVSCATKSVAAATEKCHRGTPQGPTIGDGHGCTDVQERVAPFMKSSGPLKQVFVVPAASPALDINVPVRPIEPARVLGTGPPDRLAVVPLRI